MNLDELGPHFLGIGAQRSGSSWLYRNLAACPEIWLPPVKELHYFDELRQRPIFNDRYRKQRGKVLSRYRGALKHRDLSGLTPLWDAHFLLRIPNDRWYRRVFSPGRGRICGEITPAYAVLDEAAVAQIHRLLPDTKILFLMRDPVDRAWSQARKDLPRVFGQPIDKIAREDVLAWFGGPWCLLRSDYVRTLGIWRKVYGAETVFVDYYESIKSEPETLLRRVLDFLGVKDVAGVHSDAAHEVVNRGREAPMPAEYRRHAAQLFLPMLERLASEMGGLAEQWRARNENIAAGKQPDAVC